MVGLERVKAWLDLGLDLGLICYAIKSSTTSITYALIHKLFKALPHLKSSRALIEEEHVNPFI